MSPVGLGRRLRVPVPALLGVFIVSACLSDPSVTPPPTPSAQPTALPGVSADASAEPTATDEAPAATDRPADPTAPAAEAELSPAPSRRPAPTARPRAQNTLVVMAPEHPTRLLPGDNLNATEALLVDVLYDPLYRLDERMEPVPELARGMPGISKDGRKWTIAIKKDASFHSGEKVKADDVIFSLRLASSPSCPLGRTLCEAVRTHLLDVARDKNEVALTLSEPYAPFLTEVLGRLPILSAEDVRKATRALVEAAGRLNENRPDRVIADITDQTLREACLDPDPPRGCLLRHHRERIERIFERARIDLPPQAPYVDETGIFDEDAYLADLLRRLEALAQVFDSEAAHKQSAALGLLDATVKPFGGGPYELVRIEDDGTYVLRANPRHTRSAARIPRMEVRVERNDALATTRLLTGEADWILDVSDDQARIIDESPGFRAASRPLETQYGVLFNVRPDRVYFDIETRRAFVQCIDREGLATALDEQRHLADTPFTAGSWAQPEAGRVPRDVAAANARLEQAGWRMATDGVRVRDDGTRLSTTIAVRPTSVDLFTFANQAAEQLADCGIELIVDELDLTGDTMLSQLQYPNDFDTIMWARWLGPDPDSAVRAFESSRITDADTVADENASGFISELVDFYVADARETLDQEQRVEAYAKVQEEIETLVPYWPLWYDSATSAISERVVLKSGPVDPSRSRYDWDISAWALRPADAATAQGG